MKMVHHEKLIKPRFCVVLVQIERNRPVAIVLRIQSGLRNIFRDPALVLVLLKQRPESTAISPTTNNCVYQLSPTTVPAGPSPRGHFRLG